MKTIISRLRRFEERAAGPNFGGPNPAEVLWERRRQRLEREGVPTEELPPPWAASPSDGPFNPLALTLSLAETHRRRQEIRSGVLDAEVLRNARARRWAEWQGAEVGQQ